MECEFKVGEVLRCVETGSGVTAGELYVVRDVEDREYGTSALVRVEGDARGKFAGRFRSTGWRREPDPKFPHITEHYVHSSGVCAWPCEQGSSGFLYALAVGEVEANFLGVTLSMAEAFEAAERLATPKLAVTRLQVGDIVRCVDAPSTGPVRGHEYTVAAAGTPSSSKQLIGLSELNESEPAWLSDRFVLVSRPPAAVEYDAPTPNYSVEAELREELASVREELEKAQRECADLQQRNGFQSWIIGQFRGDIDRLERTCARLESERNEAQAKVVRVAEAYALADKLSEELKGRREELLAAVHACLDEEIPF